MDVLQAGFLFLAALVGGALNSVAGGGSFIAFPALLYAGIPPINANATNTIALWPGSAAGAWAYRKEIATERGMLLRLGLISLVGGIIGAVLLLLTPQNTFKTLIPYLLLVATLLFTFSKQLVAFLRKLRKQPVPDPTVKTSDNTTTLETPEITVGFLVMQFITAIYGGYFGGGIGILMLATFAVMGMQNIHTMNGLKTLLATFINGVAVVTFVLAGAISWPQASVMVVGGITGGYFGAAVARKIDPALVRRFVVVMAFIMTTYFFITTYFIKLK
jgi:uncharacterized membrane protein YfcA